MGHARRRGTRRLGRSVTPPVAKRASPESGLVAMQYVMELAYRPMAGSTGPLIVTTRASILSAAEAQLRFSVKGINGSLTQFGLDPQESFLELGKPARGDGYGVEVESAWGHAQRVKEDGGEALGPKTA